MGAAGDAYRPPASPLGWLRVLWPLCLLIGVEVVAVALIATTAAITYVSLAVGACILLTGVLPALLRPSPATNLFGCFAVLLAGVLLFMPGDDPASLHPFYSALLLEHVPAVPMFRLANGVFIAPLVLHITTRFPRPSPVPATLLVWCYALAGLLLPVALFAPPVGLRLAVMAALTAACLGMMLVASVLLVRASRDPQHGHQRAAQQARLLLLSVALSLLSLLLRPLARGGGANVLYDLLLAGPIILPLGITYTILQHDLFGIDAALRRALAYTTVSITALAAYFGLTAVLTSLLIQIPLPFRELATLAGLVGAAFAFAPLQRHAQRLIDHAFYPERRAFQAALRAARPTLAQVIHRDALIALLTEELPVRINAAWARLALGAPLDRAPCRASDGLPFPLLVGGRQLGVYWLGPRRSGLGYAADEQADLLALLQQAALALAYAEVFEELSLLNQDLEERVATRTSHLLAQQRALVAIEERQRLARDLHDSVKQTLFSLGLGLRASRSMVQHNPDGAVQMLQIQEELAVQAQTEMGALLRQLRTPARDKCDLVAALSQLCAELGRQQKLAVTMRAPPALELPQPLANELHQIAKEALHNVVKHSGVNAAQLSLAINSSHLELLVDDRGRGFDQEQPSRDGYGICGMYERVEAIGGRLDIRSLREGGTTVWVQVPLP